jgi:cytochrome b subunit of formate dehydrogenase
MPSERRTTIAEDPPLLRFDRVERTLHWVNATLFGILMLTGAVRSPR